MRDFSVYRLIPLLMVGLLSVLTINVFGQSGAVILEGAQLTRVTPTSFYYQGQSAPTQMRNAAAVKFVADRFVIAGLVDTSGYSTEIQGKYVGFFITDSPVSVAGTSLGTGAYGFGFSNDGKFNVFDIGGKQLISVEAHQDKALKRPKPLMMTKEGNEIRLYNGRNYVVFTAA